MCNNVGYLYLLPVPFGPCYLLLKTLQLLPGDPRLMQAPPHGIGNVYVLTSDCLSALTLTIPSHPPDRQNYYLFVSTWSFLAYYFSS